MNLKIRLKEADVRWKTAESERSELISQHEDIIRQKGGKLSQNRQPQLKRPSQRASDQCV